MYISQQALDLLLAGKFSELQALSYQDLLPHDVRQEILNTFLNDSFINTTHEALQDAVTMQNVKNACVVSSGHIYSESIIQELLRNRTTVNCPTSRRSLVLNLADQGQAYVRLPRIDTILECFSVLRAMNQSMSMTEMARAAEQKKEDLPTPESDAFFEFKVSNGRMKLRFSFHRNSKNYVQHLSDYLEFMLPKGEIPSDWPSYFMNTKQVGRCWAKLSENSVMISLWYPTAIDIGRRRTFSENDINQVLKLVSTIFKLPMEEDVGPATPCYTLSALDSKTYVMLMDKIPTSFDQALASIHRFLSYTTRAAKSLRFEVVDEVKAGSNQPIASKLIGFGQFGSQHNIVTSTQQSLSSSFQHK